MSTLALDSSLSSSEVQALETLRHRFAREVRYPFLSDPELRRLDFWRYHRALHGRPRDPDLAQPSLVLGRSVELYLTGYGRRRPR